MTPSKPAVGVPMLRCLREPGVPSERRRTALDGRKSDAHIPPLHPELVVPALTVIHRQKNSGPGTRHYAAERALRAVALGRKNYLFAGSDAGGERAAAINSLIGSATLTGRAPGLVSE